jgi:hypothetical protein
MLPTLARLSPEPVAAGFFQNDLPAIRFPRWHACASHSADKELRRWITEDFWPVKSRDKSMDYRRRGQNSKLIIADVKLIIGADREDGASRCHYNYWSSIPL